MPRRPCRGIFLGRPLGSSIIAPEPVSRKIAAGATWMVAWRMVTRSLGLVSTLIMARILVPADFGLVAMATTFAAAIDMFSQMGLQEALIRRQDDDERLHDTAFTLQFGRALLTAAAIAAGTPWAARWFAEPRLVPVLLILAGLSVATGLRNVGVVAFRRDLDFRRQFVLLSVPRLIQVAVTIPVALYFRNHWALVFGIAVSKLAETAMTYAVHPYRPRLSLTGWRELAGFSAWTWITALVSIVWDRCDPFVIGPAVGPARLGVYLLAVELACLPVTELVAPATDALFSGLSLARKQGTSPIANALPAATALLLIVMPFMIAISCVAGQMVAVLLGPKWAEAGPLVAIAVWLGLFSPYSFVCGVALVAANKMRDNFIANATASAVKLLGLVVVVALTGDLVAIVAAVVAIVGLEAGLFVAALVRAGDARAAESLGGFVRIVLAGAIALAVAWLTGLGWQSVAMPVWQAILSGGSIGAASMAVFAGCVFGLWRFWGKPEGPETLVGRLIARFAAPVLAKFGRRGLARTGLEEH